MKTWWIPLLSLSLSPSVASLSNVFAPPTLLLRSLFPSEEETSEGNGGHLWMWFVFFTTTLVHSSYFSSRSISFSRPPSALSSIFFLLLILVSNTTGFYLTSPFPYTHFISSLSSSSTSVFTPASSSSQTVWKAVSDSIHYTYSQRADESVTNTQHRQGEEIKARRAGESKTDEMKRLMTEPETSTFPPDIKTNLPNTTQRRLITSSEGGEQINKSQTDVLRTLFYSQCPRSILTLERIYWCPKGKFSAV